MKMPRYIYSDDDNIGYTACPIMMMNTKARQANGLRWGEGFGQLGIDNSKNTSGSKKMACRPMMHLDDDGFGGTLLDVVSDNGDDYPFNSETNGEGANKIASIDPCHEPVNDWKTNSIDQKMNTFENGEYLKECGM